MSHSKQLFSNSFFWNTFIKTHTTIYDKKYYTTNSKSFTDTLNRDPIKYGLDVIKTLLR